MKYFDVFAESGFHSALLTTYEFGAQAFEDIPFSRLRGSGCRNIVILADRQMGNQSFAELDPPKFAGSSYHLVKADASAAFHAKITLLIGAKKGRLLIVSANLTALDLGGNKKIVASLSYGEDITGNARHFASVLNYIRRKVPPDDLSVLGWPCRRRFVRRHGCVMHRQTLSQSRKPSLKSPWCMAVRTRPFSTRSLSAWAMIG